MSKQRDEMMRIMRSSCDHPTAEELFMECKSQNVSISLATVYRNLGILVKKELLRKISIIGEPDRYDVTLVNHDHILCEDCKKVRDVNLEDFTKQIEDEIGSPILSYNLNIRYICPACKVRRKENKHG